MKKKMFIVCGLLIKSSYSDYSSYNNQYYGNDYRYKQDDDARKKAEENKKQQDLMDRMEKQQQENMKKQLISTYRNSFDKKFQIFFSIIDKSTRTFSQPKMASIFDYLGSKYGQSFLYRILINLDSAVGKSFMKVYFPDNAIPDFSNTADTNTNFYTDLLNNVKSTFSDDDYQTFKGFMKDALKDKWDKIAKEIGEGDTAEKDPGANAANNSIWGTNTNTSNLLELTTLLKKKNVTQPEIYFQFLKDFSKIYYSQDPKTQDASQLLLTTNTQKSDYQDLDEKLKSFMIQYQSILQQKNINSDFLKNAGNIIKTTFKSVYPQTTAVMYKLYLSQIEKNSKLKSKIDNGFRVDVQKTLSDYQASGDKTSLKWDSDVLAFMCIQTLGMLEDSFSKPENAPLSKDDFAQKIKEQLNGIANGIDHNGSIDSIAQSVLTGVVSKYQSVDQNILFGLIIYQMIENFKFTSQQQVDVVNGIQSILTGNNISLESIKTMVQTFNQNKQQNQAFVKALIQINSSKLLDPFNAKNDQKQEPPQNQVANTMNKNVQSAFGSLLGGLFK